VNSCDRRVRSDGDGLGVSRRHLSGTIGGGGRSLEMETVNGSIHLMKSS